MDIRYRYEDSFPFKRLRPLTSCFSLIDTLVTCFPGDNCDDSMGRCQKLHLECIMLEQVKRKCGDGKCDAKRLASHIIYRSYSIFTHRHLRNPNLRFVDVFERAISEQVNFMVNNPSNFLTSVQRANSTDLFRALEMKKKSGSFFSRRSPVTHGDYSKGENSLDRDTTRKTRRRRRRDVFNLQEDIEAVGQIRSIHGELHIMLRIVSLQMKALERTRLPKWEVWKEDLTNIKERLEGLSAQTKDINELVSLTHLSHFPCSALV